jgi:phage-related protein
MATTKDQLTIEIAVNSEKAVKSLDNINDKLSDFGSSAKDAQKNIGGFGFGMVKLQAGIALATQAFGAIKDVMGGVIESFQESYDATVKLQQALEITGSKSVDSTIQAFQELGNEFVRLGISSDETVLNLARMGTAAGISSEKIQKMLKVAADLSVARDIPLTTAFTALTKSLKGSSIAISQFIPELSELSSEQNKAGVALDYLDSQYSGFASRNLETFSGKIAAQKGAWGELMETLGGVASEILNLGSSIDATTGKINGINNSITENKIQWIAAGQAIVSLFKQISNNIIGTLTILLGLFEQVAGKAISVFGTIAKGFNLLTGMGSAGSGIKKFGDDLAAIGKENTKALDGVVGGLSATDDELKIISNTVGRTREELLKARDAAKAFNDKLQNAELLKKVEDYNNALALAGKTGIDLIRAKEVEDLKELDRLAEKIKGTQGLGKANQALLATAKANVSAASAASAAELQKKSLDELTAKTIDYQKTVNSFNATQRQQIQFELEAELQKLDIARKKAQLENNPKAVAEIDKQAGLATEAAGKKTAAAPSNMFEGLQKAGSEVAGQISGVFSEGALGMVAGAASMAGAIMSAIDALLDFIPNILNQAAGIFNKIGDFPNVLFNAFQGLFDAFSTFIPKLIRGIFDTTMKLFTQIGDFVNNFVNGIVQLIDDLPDMISGIIENLPSLIISLMENIIKGSIKLFVAIFFKLPIAISKGFIKGIVQLIEGVKRLLSGKSFNVKVPKIDPAPLVKAVKKLSGDSSKLFAVNDMMDGAKDAISSVTDTIKDAFKKGKTTMEAVWQWVIDKVWGPLKGLVENAWQFVLKLWTGLKTIVEAAWAFVELLWHGLEETVKVAWKLVVDLWEGLENVVAKAWQFVTDLWNSLPGAVSAAWQFVTDLWNSLPGAVSAAWQFVTDLWNSLPGAVSAAWQFVTDLWNSLPGAVSAAWQFVSKLWEGLKDIVSGAFAIVTVIFTAIGEAIKSYFKAGMVIVKVVFDSIIAAFTSIWDTVKVIFDFIFTSFSAIWEGLKSAVSSAFSFVQVIWDGLKGAVGLAFKFVKDLWDALVNIVKAAFESPEALFKALKATVELAFKFVKDLFDNMATVVKGAFTFVKEIFEGLATVGGKIWEGLKEGLGKAGDIFAGFGTKIWEGLKGGLDGLGKIFSDMFDALNPANLMKKVFNFDGASGKGTVENALNIDIPFLSFARGGVVPGKSTVRGDSIKNDNVIAMLSPGEVVIPRSKMDDPRTRQIIEDVMSGSMQPPGFFSGKIKISTPKIPSMSDIIDTVTKATDDIANAVEVAAGQASDAGAILNQQVIAGTQVAIDQATGIAQGAGDWLGDVFNGANPLKQLWETVSNKVKKEMLDPMFQKNRFAAGGPVGTDTVPAMLTPGEFIMSRPAVNSIGLDNLRSMNSGKTAAAGNQTVNIEINFNDAQISMDKNLIRDKLLPEIRDALKRASLNGEFVLSNKGIRA